MKKCLAALLAACFVLTGNVWAAPKAEAPQVSDADKGSFTITASSQQDSLGPEKLLDGDMYNLWHSNFNGPGQHPYVLTIDMGKTFSISSIGYMPRQDDSVGRWMKINLYLGLAENNLTLVKTQEFDAASYYQQEISFAKTAARYIKIEILETKDGHAAASELLFGAPEGNIDDIKPGGQFRNISAGEAALKSADVTIEGGMAKNFSMGQYIGFRGVNFDGTAKSVILEASSHMEMHADGDVFKVRLDAPNGRLIGTVDLDTNLGIDVYREFTGALETVTGTHDVYFVSSFARFDSARIKTIRFSEKAYAPAAYVPTPQERLVDNYHDTWVATDALGRSVAGFEEVGPVKDDKVVGMFYWPWHATFEFRTPFNNTQAVTQCPEAKNDYNHPIWPTGEISYFWDEPLFGYYSGTDYWVLRKQVQMLADAGVDVLFLDNTNGAFAWRDGVTALCRAMHDAREEGLKTPQIAFMSNFAAVSSTNELVREVYDFMYKPGKFSDLWFYWEGKPLILAYPEAVASSGYDRDLTDEILNFFTFRKPQASYTAGPSDNDQWGWLEVYPQHKYHDNGDGTFEMMTVGTSANHSYKTNQISSMNDDYVMDRSYTDAFGPDKTQGAELHGYFLDEQFRYAIEQNPQIIFVTGWNEYTAGRNPEWGGTPNGFPDQFDKHASRDIEPSAGELGDNYYFQLVDNIRKFRGARPIPLASDYKTIDISGNVSQWDSVGPEFINDRGTYHRDSKGYGALHYTNNTARNNVVLSKVARDENYLYFYAQTDQNITAADDSAWMQLFLNIDRNPATGWEGYDFVVNRKKPGQKAFLEKNTGGYNWKDAASVDFTVKGKVLQLKIPKSALGLSDLVDIEFKWADNTGQAGDIMAFWVNGNAAPLGRFNYCYTEIPQLSLGSDARQKLSGVTVLTEGSSKATVNGGRMQVYDADTSVTTFQESGALYFPATLLADSLAAKVTWDEKTKTLTVKTREITASCAVGEKQAQVGNTVNVHNQEANARAVSLENPVLLRGGVPFVPVSFVGECFGLSSAQISEGVVAFGKNINLDAARQAAGMELSQISLGVAEFPSKREYKVGDDLDVSGGRIAVTYQKGAQTFKTYVAVTPSMVSGFNSAKTGEQTLTISYQAGGMSLSGNVTYKVVVKDGDGKPGGGGTSGGAGTPGGGSGKPDSGGSPGGAVGPVATPVPSQTPKVSLKQGPSAYINGYSDGTFGPDRAITRAEVLTILSKICLVTGASDEPAPYGDVSGHWAAPQISLFYQAGVVKGYADGLFRPDNAMSRGEFCVVMSRVLGEETAGRTAPFGDTAGHFAEGAISVLQEKGYINGYADGTFGPDKSLTRAETVAMINRILNIPEDTGKAQKFYDLPAAHWAYGAVMSVVS